MHSSYWWGISVPNFLFKGYTINSTGGLIATCFMLTAFSIVYEFLKVLQGKLRQEELKRKRQTLLVRCPNSSSFTLENGNTPQEKLSNFPCSNYRFCRFVYEFFMWLSLELLGYFLMLAVMLFNGYMTIAVVIGSGLGYFIFGPTLEKINMENRQVKKESLCLSSCEEPDGMIRTTGSVETTTTVTEQGSQEEITPIQCTALINSPCEQNAE